MAKKSKKDEETVDQESVDKVVANDQGTTLDDPPANWDGRSEKGAKPETDEQKDARSFLGR